MKKKKHKENEMKKLMQQYKRTEKNEGNFQNSNKNKRKNDQEEKSITTKEKRKKQ